MTLALGAALTLAACGSSNNNGGARKASPSASASSPASNTASASADPESAAKQDVISAYKHYWDEEVIAYSKASMDGTDLKKYANGNALGLVKSDLLNLKKAGQVTEGKPHIDPKVTSLDLQKKVPSAQITDCVDVSPWKVLDAKTKSVVALPTNRRTKYVSIVSAERWGKQWVMLQVNPEDRAC
ncbi:hypothetical protein AB0L75_42110 [Streptomyces sp. NPDC052101]|uniref:hypothetical protein n=1 Tax=Streptomyces sp. NPDC052101 TaxID=3155763 RepID=UPI00343A2ADD